MGCTRWRCLDRMWCNALLGVCHRRGAWRAWREGWRVALGAIARKHDARACASAHMDVHAHAHMHTCTHAHMRTCAHAHVHAHACSVLRMHTRMRMQAHAMLHALLH